MSFFNQVQTYANLVAFERTNIYVGNSIQFLVLIRTVVNFGKVFNNTDKAELPCSLEVCYSFPYLGFMIFGKVHLSACMVWAMEIAPRNANAPVETSILALFNPNKSASFNAISRHNFNTFLLIFHLESHTLFSLLRSVVIAFPQSLEIILVLFTASRHRNTIILVRWVCLWMAWRLHWRMLRLTTPSMYDCISLKKNSYAPYRMKQY